ncbi:hypothetical protein [Flavisolibacter ginsenosidimutans]|uniref:Uncharacterized protein n=1 Tax=Flavisolibacter ginsenosidimutans TaxID=661481 RepID=A0A5B8UHE2_9BACT|nr:hypothetical protein [Flavisolibacter ginsenosidimutans]QEC55765.1 hypothetical protein FSB75_07625 [Flavisolibacter ginsenosidimutans]
MNLSLSARNQNIKKEADEILHQQGLLSILQRYGAPHITGSYNLDLMTWRDLDIYLQTDSINEGNFFSLGGEIATLLQPVKMSFRNEVLAKTEGLPNGFYWGIYLGDERAGAWKIDVWAVNKTECERLLDYCRRIKAQLTPETRLKILEIKSHCWQHPEYRRSFSSKDIYEAVLQNGVSDIDCFRSYIRQKSKLPKR